MKIRKNALMLSVIALLLIPAFAMSVKPSFGLLPDDQMVSIDSVDAPLLIGEIFTVNVYVWNVEAMFGYALRVSYDTALLAATGNWGAYYPFEFFLGEDFTHPGILTIASTMTPPELVGFYWDGQYPIAWIEFQVLDPQASPLMLSDTQLSDIHGMAIPHSTENGYVRNLPGAPIAWFAPPEPAQALEDVTFTSLSWTPDGTIADADIQWDFGDGYTATGGTATHHWDNVGAYPVTLTVKNDAEISDTQIHTMTIVPQPLAGAIGVSGFPTQLTLNFTKTGSHKQILKAYATNIDATRKTLVRVDLDIWSADYGHVGAVPTKNQWIQPGDTKLFQGEFDMMDGKWYFVGGAVPEEEFTVIVSVYYADFFYNNDPTQPHWAQVEDAPLVSYTFLVVESPPELNWVHSYNSTTGILNFGSTSTDKDIKWGDSIVQYRWRVYVKVGATWYYFAQVFGPSATVDVVSTMTGYFGEAWDDTFRLRAYVTDSFGVMVFSDVYEFLDLPGV